MEAMLLGGPMAGQEEQSSEVAFSSMPQLPKERKRRQLVASFQRSYQQTLVGSPSTGAGKVVD